MMMNLGSEGGAAAPFGFCLYVLGRYEHIKKKIDNLQ